VKEFNNVPWNFATLPEIERAAKNILPPEVWDFGKGGAETETTLRRNHRALKQLAIRQRVLADVHHIDLSTTLAGIQLPMPVAVAPIGALALFHPEGDLEMARGAGLSNNLSVVSGATGWPVEDVAREAKGPLWFQLYHFGDRSWVKDLLGRVEASGYRAVCLTVDAPVYGRRERDLRRHFDPRSASEAILKPPPADTRDQAKLNWEDVSWLRSMVSVPFGLKGILTPEDARLAVEAGVQIVWVSNHGGRQLDHTQATIDALPEIVDAVAGRAEIVIDGGFGRGADVIKAIALGAKVVAIGRMVLWGLVVAGAAGVDRTLQLLREEMTATLALCGQTSIRGLKPDLIRRVLY